MNSALGITLLLILLILTAFFVASEFAIVKVRRSKIEQLVVEGDKNAERVLKILNNLDGYLSACQLGITLTALGIGWLGEPTVAKMILPISKEWGVPDSAAHTVSFIIAFSVITFLHVVLGELAPKTIAIQKSGKLALLFAKPLIFFYKTSYPLIWTLNGSANRLVRLLGFTTVKEDDDHSEEEIKIIVSNSKDLDPDEQNMVQKVFNFDERIVREIMVHRKDMFCLKSNCDIQTNIGRIKESTFSRFPVIGKDLDDIIGYVTLRDVYNHDQDNDFDSIIRKMPIVVETSLIKNVLKSLQKNKQQIAIVLDEYGGVSGMITVEDIVEELVGNIRDEYDNEEEPFKTTSEGIVIQGNVLIDEVNEQLGTELEDIDGFDTIAGYLVTKLDLSKEDKIKLNSGEEFIVLKKDGQRVKEVLYKK